MKITITAELTEEQTLILATEKGYTETITNVIDGSVIPMVTEQIPNPQTAWEFLSKVYQSMIANDAERIYLDVFNRRINAENEEARQVIRDQIATSLTSSVE